LHSYIRPKAIATGAKADLHEGFLTGEFLASAVIDLMASPLVFHRVPLAGEREFLRVAPHALKPAERLVIADCSLQRTPSIRRLFRATVQSLDGVDHTQPNADGRLPKLVNEAEFAGVQEACAILTATGSISILTAYC